MATNQIQELNFDEILSLFQGQLIEHMNSPEYFEKYNGTKIILSKEQQFIKLKDKDPNAIYIVVQFGSADIMFGQTVLPVTIVAMTEQNKIDLAYTLFYEYAQKYNLVRVNDNTINQVYESPSMSSGFNELWDGFRGMVTMSAAYVIGKNSNEYDVYYYYDYKDENGNEYKLVEEVPIISATYAFVGSPDTQAFYNTQNFVKSEIGFGGMTIGFSAFIMSDSRIMSDVLDVFGELNKSADAPKAYLVKPTDEIQYANNGVVKIKKGGDWVDAETKYSASVNNTPVNKNFKFGIIYKDGDHARIKDYKITSASSTREIGQIPIITLAFTE